MLDLRPVEPALWKANSMKWRHRINLTSVSPASKFDNAGDHYPDDFHNNVHKHFVQDLGVWLKGAIQQ
jgi:hypothetical protein